MVLCPCLSFFSPGTCSLQKKSQNRVLESSLEKRMHASKKLLCTALMPVALSVELVRIALSYIHLYILFAAGKKIFSSNTIVCVL